MPKDTVLFNFFLFFPPNHYTNVAFDLRYAAVSHASFLQTYRMFKKKKKTPRSIRTLRRPSELTFYSPGEIFTR